MSIYLSNILNIPHTDINYDDVVIVPINNGWNDNKNFRVSVSEGAKHHYQNNPNSRKERSKLLRGNEKLKTAGHKGFKHTKESKEIQKKLATKRMSASDQALMVKMFNDGESYRHIANVLNFSPTAIRRRLKNLSLPAFQDIWREVCS